MKRKNFQHSSVFTTLNKEVWVGWISSGVEAYNMAIYSFMAPLLAKRLFQHASESKALFFSYSLVFIASCLLYPAGSIYYGYIGDQQGRQKTCVYSTLGLAMATGLMGFIPFHFLPDYAWIFFLILICAQHFFSGGEYYGSIVFSLEHSELKQSGFMSSLSCLFAVLGLVLANGLSALSFILEDDLWIRFCFFLGGLGGIISYQLKNYCRETPAFKAVINELPQAMNEWAYLKTRWCSLLSVVMVFAFFIVSYTFIFIFLPLMNYNSHDTQTFDTFKSLIGYGIFLIIAGWVADKIGIETVMLTGITLFSIVIIPLCYLCDNLWLLQILLTPCACLVIGPIHSWMLCQFEVKNRCRGIFICSAIVISIFGGSTVPICLMIFDNFHSLIICCIYPLIIAIGAFIALISLVTKKANQPQFINESI